MTKHKVTLIPGEGIGPEVAAATRRILEATGVQIDWEEIAGRSDSSADQGKSVNQAAVESVRKNCVALKGPMATAIAGGAPSVNVALRRTLDPSTRIAKFAFEYAEHHGRKKIHAIHKANIMKLSDGLFLKSVRAVAAQFPAIEYKELIVDNACMQIVMDPLQFDMLLLPNLYGDVMSDLAAGLVGGLGVVPSANIGDVCAMFEAVHGTAPDIAGKGFANPTALLMSSALMLDHLGETKAAERIQKALEKVYRQAKHTTRDVGGKAGTEEFADAVIAALNQK